MKQKLILFICCISSVAFAQKLGPATINSGGQSIQDDDNSYIFSIGEVMNTTISNAELTMKQGVIQDAETSPPPPMGNCARNSASVFFERCPEDNNVTYVFYEMEDGTILDPYFNGISFTNYDGQYVNFDFIDADFETPCARADKAVIITCIEETLPPPDCSKNEGTIFFAPCEGETFFFIATTEGDTLDPYYDDGISFEHSDGQNILFDFVDADFDSPCEIADKAVTVRCISEKTSSADDVSLQLLDVFPNPAKNTFYMQAEEAIISTLTIINIDGRRVTQRKVNHTGGILEVPVQDLPTGLYLIEAQTDRGILTGKILISK